MKWDRMQGRIGGKEAGREAGRNGRERKQLSNTRLKVFNFHTILL
jgi:hypothetical protein